MALTRRFRRLATFAVVTAGLAQLATVGGLLVWASQRRKHRVPVGFPYLPPRSVTVRDSEVTVYTYGEHLYDAMIESIDAATDRVYLETFIWKNDPVGQRFKDALVRASERGVQVYVMYDVFANLVVSPAFFRFPRSVHVHPHPLFGGGLLFFHPRNSGRDHRKLVVVDGTTAFVGGYNIGELYARQWRDTHVRITGDIVTELDNAFADQWNGGPGAPRYALPSPQQRTWRPDIRVHRNTPRLFVYPIRNMYLEAIDRATDRIWLTHAYLVPDDDVSRALVDAAGRGVEVSIIIPAESNHIVADWLARSQYTRLLEAGVKLFLYQGAMIHSKTATIDGVWTTIGTANLDRLSLVGNYELNLEVTNQALAAVMEEVFATDLTNCERLTLDQWRRRGVTSKVTELILSPLAPLV